VSRRATPMECGGNDAALARARGACRARRQAKAVSAPRWGSATALQRVRPGLRGLAGRDVLVVAVAAVLVAVGVGAVIYAVRHTSRPRDANFMADVPALVKTDPNLVLYDEVGGFATGFSASRTLAAAADGTLLVTGDQAVRYFDANGARLREVAVPEPPGPAAVAADGTLYVATRDRVLVYGPDGRAQSAWEGAGEKALLTGLAVTDTDVLVADAGNRVVRWYDRAGVLLGTIGRKDEARNVPGFVIPSPCFDLAMGSDGLLRVANPGRRRVEAYTLSGDFEGSWGRYGVGPEGFSGCCNPVNFAMIAPPRGRGPVEGFLTCEKGLTRVKRYDGQGRFQGYVAGHESFARHDEILAGKPTGQPFFVLDVAVDAAGRVAVLDPLTNRVRLFRPKAQASPGPKEVP